MEEVINGILIREVETKNIMTKSSLPVGGYSVNPYVGCTHACKYCYASFMKRFTGHKEEWGTFLDVKHWPKIKNPKKYPNAKLLVARRKDFETANRKKFCARIATGDYDAVIIGHSQFERIPLSFERQERIIQEQIDEIQDAISELKYASGERFTVKQMEKSRKNLEQKLEKLRAADRKDDVITFEQLGVDRLFVDESHAFKNLFLYTKMRNVAGLSTSEAQKSSDMFGKCRYLDEVTGGRGVIFATGTPVSNSMTELYTVMRYLQYGTLQKKNLTHFDCWASTFGETTTAIELAPEGYTLIGR